MMSALVDSLSPLRVSGARPIFEFELDDLRFHCVPVRCFDVAADGQRFYVSQAVRGPAAPAVTHVNLVLNWADELRLKVPAR